jgi:hypothetical protein
MRRDGEWLQVFRECGHYLGRHRTCSSDTQKAILVWARSISKLRVTKANLGPSIRVAPPGSESSNLRSGPDSRPEAPISTPLMHRFLFEDGGLLYRGHINVLNFPFRQTSPPKACPRRITESCSNGTIIVITMKWWNCLSCIKISGSTCFCGNHGLHGE